MKKILVKCLIMVLTAVIALQNFAFASEQEISVLLDGQEIVFDVKPTIIEGRTMVPLRAIFEALGAKVEYDNDTRTITAEDASTKVVLVADSTQMSVNDEVYTLDVPATIIDGRTLVPVRAISEAFKCAVDWDAQTYTVIIESPAEDIYSYPSPVIDFSGDDGIMSTLHLAARKDFEQRTLPELVYGNADFGKIMMENPEEALKYIDNDAWAKSMNTSILQYLIECEEVYEVSSEQDVIDLINEFADKYSLRAYQSYSIDAVMLGENKYCIVLSLADIYDSLKVDALDKLLLGTYAAIVYDSEVDAISYYVLEENIDDSYVICHQTAEGNHKMVGAAENNKKSFVETLEAVINKE